MFDMNFFKSIEGRDTALQRVDGRVKTVFFLVGVIVSSIVTHWFQAAILWGVAVVLFSTLRLPWRLLVQRLIIPFGIAWLVFFSLIFTNGQHALVVVMHRPFTLTVYAEGLSLGVLLLLRIMAAVTMACVLSFSTPMVEILETLRLLKIPGIIVDIASMMFRYVFILHETARNMYSAQLCRTTRRLTWMEQIRNTGQVAVHVLGKSLDRSVRIYNAMLARGYDDENLVPAYFAAPVAARDVGIGVLLTAFPLAILVLNHFA